MPESTPTTVNSLYVHVPFCAQKCVYCAFYSEASSGELVTRYTAALVRELELVADDLRPTTIFVGGDDMYFGNDRMPLIRDAVLRRRK